MEQTSNQAFIVIDDDPISNHICTRLIEVACPGATVLTFTEPEDGLKYLSGQQFPETEKPIILLLDINMPVLSGWDVLTRYADLPETTRKKFIIYMLSSSVAIEDKRKASENIFVAGFLEKPLTVPQIKKIAG